ncbi:MAG: hypothetical protein IKC53_11760 [Lentisphaeria bacterium]|nr:hypothetical protein [Lentisphaeria bacterium]
MAGSQNRSPVPAHWRIVFATVLVLAFMFGGLLFVRKDAVPPRDSADNAMDARIRLQTAAVAFSSGKLAPRVLILTDWPESYWKKDGVFPEFLKFRDSLVVAGPASIPEYLLVRDFLPQFQRFFYKDEDSLDTVLRQNRDAIKAPYDVILLDCAFPDNIFSRKSLLWSSSFFDRLKKKHMTQGGVCAVVLPPDKPEVSACVLAFLRRSFGNAGAFCFGDRVILASGLNAEPVFELDKLSTTAELAGYYDGEGIPNNAIGLVLADDYSDSIPAGLLEASHNIAIPQKVFTPFLAVFARAKYGAQVKRFLPDGFPVQTVCAWLLGILLAVYPFLRYFISWKPVHKQAFRAFEDMFYLTGVLALFMMFCQEYIQDSGLIWVLLFPVAIFVFYKPMCESAAGMPQSMPVAAKWGILRTLTEDPVGRFFLYLAVAAFLGCGFFQEVKPNAGPFGALFFAAFPLRARMKEPVQLGPAIPLAYLFGVAASLALFAVSLCFPLGAVVFAAVVCVYRLILLDC